MKNLPPKQAPNNRAQIRGPNGRFKFGLVDMLFTTLTIIVVNGILSTNADVIPDTFGDGKNNMDINNIYLLANHIHTQLNSKTVNVASKNVIVSNISLISDGIPTTEFVKFNAMFLQIRVGTHYK